LYDRHPTTHWIVDKADQLGKPTEHAAGLPFVLMGFHVHLLTDEVVDQVAGVFPVKRKDIPSRRSTGLFVVMNEEAFHIFLSSSSCFWLFGQVFKVGSLSRWTISDRRWRVLPMS